MQYRQASCPGSFRHFCLRDLHLSHDVSVRLRLSRGTLRGFQLAVAVGVGVGVEVDAGFDVIGAGGIIMAATSDWRGGSGPRRRRALEARENRVNRTTRLQPSEHQSQGLKTSAVRRYPQTRPLFGSPQTPSAPSRTRSECIGDSQLQEHGVGSPRILPCVSIFRLLFRHRICNFVRAQLNVLLEPTSSDIAATRIFTKVATY